MNKSISNQITALKLKWFKILEDSRNCTEVNFGRMVDEVVEESRIMNKCKQCGNELTEELAGYIKDGKDCTYVRVYCECCGGE